MKRIIVLSVLLSFALALPMEAQHVDRGVLERKMDEAIAKHRREKAAQQAKEAEKARQVQQSVDNHQRQAREIDSNYSAQTVLDKQPPRPQQQDRVTAAPRAAARRAGAGNKKTDRSKMEMGPFPDSVVWPGSGPVQGQWGGGMGRETAHPYINWKPVDFKKKAQEDAARRPVRTPASNRSVKKQHLTSSGTQQNPCIRPNTSGKGQQCSQYPVQRPTETRYGGKSAKPAPSTGVSDNRGMSRPDGRSTEPGNNAKRPAANAPLDPMNRKTSADQPSDMKDDRTSASSKKQDKPRQDNYPGNSAKQGDSDVPQFSLSGSKDEIAKKDRIAGIAQNGKPLYPKGAGSKTELYYEVTKKNKEIMENMTIGNMGNDTRVVFEKCSALRNGNCVTKK